MSKNNDSEVEVLDYAKLFEVEFMRLYYELDVPSAPEKRKPDIIDSIFEEIYHIVFEPDKRQENNIISKLLYHDIENIQAVCEMYIRLCKRFGGVIKFNSFANLTGIHRDTIHRWHTINKNRYNNSQYIFTINEDEYNDDYNNGNIYIIKDNKVSKWNNMYKYIDGLSNKRYDLYKKLQENMVDQNTNGLSTDTMGQAIRANNDEEIGKLYDPKKIVLQQQAKTASLSMNDLKLLE